jgi:hypothetical protein
MKRGLTVLFKRYKKMRLTNVFYYVNAATITIRLKCIEYFSLFQMSNPSRFCLTKFFPLFFLPTITMPLLSKLMKACAEKYRSLCVPNFIFSFRVTLESFIDTQKYSVMKNMKKTFARYPLYPVPSRSSRACTVILQV